MKKYITLNSEVSKTTSSINSDDVLNIKKALNNLKYYKIPIWGLTTRTDNQLFDSITSFQKDNNLTPDGMIKPFGETEAKINEKLNVSYVWHTSGDDTCETCSSLEGTKFNNAGSIPRLPHPNCKCFVSEETSCNCKKKLEEISQLQNEIEKFNLEENKLNVELVNKMELLQNLEQQNDNDLMENSQRNPLEEISDDLDPRIIFDKKIDITDLGKIFKEDIYALLKLPTMLNRSKEIIILRNDIKELEKQISDLKIEMESLVEEVKNLEQDIKNCHICK